MLVVGDFGGNVAHGNRRAWAGAPPGANGNWAGGNLQDGVAYRGPVESAEPRRSVRVAEALSLSRGTIIPKSHGFYTKVAKSAKELATSNSFFADLATFV
jgi:hypothetical protein